MRYLKIKINRSDLITVSRKYFSTDIFIHFFPDNVFFLPNVHLQKKIRIYLK